MLRKTAPSLTKLYRLAATFNTLCTGDLVHCSHRQNDSRPPLPLKLFQDGNHFRQQRANTVKVFSPPNRANTSGISRRLSQTAAFFALLGLLAGSASAAPPPLLSIGRAIQIALHNNPGLKQTANQVTSGKISLAQSRANFLPDLQLSAQGSRQYDKQRLPAGGHSFGTLNTSVSSQLNLFNGFGDVASLQGAKFTVTARMDDLSRAQQSLVFTTASQFLTVATDRDLIRVEEENLQANRRQLEQIRSFYKAGTRPVSDLYQQQAATSSAELALLQARRDLQVTKLQLLQTIGLAPTTAVTIAVPKFQDLAKAQGEEELAKLTAQALNHRPDVLALRKQTQTARVQVRQAKAGYWPTLNLVADAGSAYSGLNSSDGLSGQFWDNNPSAAVGLNLTVPIFDRNLTRNNVAQARIQQQDAQLALDQLNLQVGTEVGQALQDYRTAQKQVQVSEAQLKYARQALAAVQERYRVGASTLVDLLQVRTQYVQAAFNQVQARYALMTQGLGLAYAQGDWANMNSLLSALEPKG